LVGDRGVEHTGVSPKNSDAHGLSS
jgi:hypothetical protein